MGFMGFSFSFKRAVGITAIKQRFARSTGIPTTESGQNQKVGRSVLDNILPWRKNETDKM